MTIKSSQTKIAAHRILPRPIGYLLIGEGNETGKYIFDLCFLIGLADTGRPHREPGGGEGADELDRQEAGGRRGWPAGCFAEPAKK